MLLLALDTATPAVTVAVHDGERVLAERTAVDPRRHGELLAPEVDAVLREAGVKVTDVTEVVVGVGPGPFTGLRVGLVTAKVLGDVVGAPVRGVCTLDVLAGAAVRTGVVERGAAFVVATDARRKEVYWARYESAAGGARRVEGPRVDKPADVGWAGPAVGAGALVYAADFPGARGPEYPSAATLAGIVVAQAVEILPVEPLYLRRPDAVAPGSRKRVTTG